MICPSCGQFMMQPGFRYLNPKVRWYQFDMGTACCPKCHARLVIVVDAWSKGGFMAFYLCLVAGMQLLLISKFHPEHPYYSSIGWALLGISAIAFIAATLNRRLAVAPTDAATGRDSN